MGEMGAVGETQKNRIKGEIWEKWGATYGRNGCGGSRNHLERVEGYRWAEHVPDVHLAIKAVRTGGYPPEQALAVATAVATAAQSQVAAT